MRDYFKDYYGPFGDKPFVGDSFPGTPVLGDGLADYDSVSRVATPEGMRGVLVCRWCGRDMICMVPWDEIALVVLAGHRVPPRLVFESAGLRWSPGPVADWPQNAYTSEVLWTHVGGGHVEGSLGVALMCLCTACVSTTLPLPHDEAVRMLGQALRLGWASPLMLARVMSRVAKRVPAHVATIGWEALKKVAAVATRPWSKQNANSGRGRW